MDNQPLVVMKQVSRNFVTPDGEVSALAGIDLVVNRGEFLAIRGSSGSGKSTLLSILGLLDKPSTGIYTLQGFQVGNLSSAEQTTMRAHGIGFVFQSFFLIDHLTVLDNVALPLMVQRIPLGLRHQRAIEALAQVGLTHRREAWPRTLSGGEAQRVAVARALVHDPEILLCDEPTGNLDAENTKSVLNLLEQVNRLGRTVVLVTHEENVAQRTQRQITLSAGRLTSDSCVL